MESSDTHHPGDAAVTAPAALDVAVLIPCLNEEKTIRQVVSEFREVLPGARIYVFDNASTDRTAQEARAAGAEVILESRRGKGHVVQSMFGRIDADVYVMVDGDGTYPASAVHSLIGPIARGEADMVIGSRLHGESQSEFRAINRLGNYLYLLVLQWIFRVRLTDLLSGYRGFSRRFVRSLPLFGGGFETEVEMTIKALHRGLRTIEVPVNLVSRPAGSHSKIRVVRDGVLILSTMLALFRDYKPLSFFGAIGLAFGAAGLVPGIVVVVEYFRTGAVARMPSAILATGLGLVGIISMVVGIILHTNAKRFQEIDRLLMVIIERTGRQSEHLRPAGHEHSNTRPNP